MFKKILYGGVMLIAFEGSLNAGSKVGEFVGTRCLSSFNGENPGNRDCYYEGVSLLQTYDLPGTMDENETGRGLNTAF